MYLSTVWKYLSVTGRSFTEMLADPQGDTMTDRPTYKKYLKVHELLADINNAEYEVKGEIRSHLLAVHSLWYSTVQHYQAKIPYATASGHVTSSSKCCSGYVYATLVFGDSVCYFLWRILA